VKLAEILEAESGVPVRRVEEGWVIPSERVLPVMEESGWMNESGLTGV